MRSTSLRKSVAIAAIAAASIAVAAATGNEAIRERQQAMEEIGKAMGSLAAIAKKQAPFDAEVVQVSAQTIAERLETAAGLFPEDSDAGDVETWAKAEIWSNAEDFQQRFEAAHEAAVAMQAVTEEAAFMPALGALGSGCKGCHEPYRRPKQ